MGKSADVSPHLAQLREQELLPEIRERWSPRAFQAQMLSESQLGLLLEAARWAPSCQNAQPWRFVVLSKGNEARAQVESYLTGGNYWAKHASHLIVACALTRFEAGQGAVNRHAFYDTGAAVLALTLQAQHLGISIHQMAGFDHQQLARDLQFPDYLEAVAILAVGFRSPQLDDLSEKHQQVEKAPRQRKPLHELYQQDTLPLHGLF